ncbi:MAG: FAD-dependent thymidylate synthase [Solidesulfovibrio sp.]|uniref:FAD-dependent thymidylate synthase n=1 Tax=Solidesulfovibrio sp. TaxID=2910990 RepID=UPI003157FC86
MKIVSPSFEVMELPNGNDLLRKIEAAGRTCYKSEDKVTETSSADFAKKLMKLGHLSVIEHVSATVRITCDRGVSHEIVRHRLASYSQESTRYANYSNKKFGGEISVVKPPFWDQNSHEYNLWVEAMENSEKAYLNLIKMGASPQQARSVLPNSLKTEIVVTCNIREWRHIFTLRCDKAAHPQMREIMIPLLTHFKTNIPILFDDIFDNVIEDTI